MVIARSTPEAADLDFQGKHSKEVFQFQIHQHWVRLLWPFCKFFLWNIIIFGTGYAIFFIEPVGEGLTRRVILQFLTLFFVLAYFELLKRFYRYLLYVVIVTDKKIHRIKKTLITTDDHISFDLMMVQDIHKTQRGLWQNILGYGTITLEAQETIMRLHFVPNVVEKYEKIMHVRERGRIRKLTSEFSRKNKPLSSL